MTTYTNPTGTFNATGGDDTIVFNTVPANTVAIDALAGNDSLLVQFDYFQGLTYDASDWNNSGAFMATAGSIIVWNVEQVEFHGTSNNDTFHLQLGTGGSSGLSAVMDGGAGDDLLKFDWSKTSTGMSFVVNGSAITSSWGTFTNFERFEIHAGSGNDTITTSSGNDNIYTGAGVDTVIAGAGTDFIYSESSGGTVDGGDGVDFYNGNFSASTTPLSVTIGDTTQISNGILVSNVESISIGGGSGDDHFTDARVQVSGSLSGGGGHDTLTFNAPSTTALQFTAVAYGDQLDGQIAVDQGNFQNFYGFESLSFTGTQFNDQFSIRADYSASSSGFSFDGAAGTDKLLGDFSLFAGATSFVVAADGSVSSNRGQFTNIETFVLNGGSGADTLITGSGADGLVGGAGSDHLDGGGGDDTIYGASNGYQDDDGVADVLIGGAGNDSIHAGSGDSVDGGSGTDDLYYDALAATAGITADFSKLTSGGSITVVDQTLTGIEYVNSIYGSNYNDTVVAGAVSSGSSLQIFGWAGDDHLTGSSGADTIYGGDGNDTLTGGLGADTLADYSGDDTFADTAAGLNGDTLSGFYVGDKIVIKDADPNSFTFSLAGGTLTYTGGSLFIGSQLPGKLVATAAAGGGVQLQVHLAPIGTNDQLANELTTGFWAGDAHHWAVTQGGTLTVNISTLNATEQNLARAALQEWTDIIGVHFQEVLTGGQIVFDHSEQPGGPVAETDAAWSGGIMSSAHVHISTSWVNAYGTALNSYGFQTYVHEIGHALGLGHPGDYNDTATYASDAMFQNDSWATSVMSYFDQSESYYFAEQHFTILNAATPMQADIVAAQNLYGFSTTTRSGDTVYGFNSNAGGVYNAASYYNVALTIFDSSGDDTIDYSNVGAGQLINLNPETFSNVNGYAGNLSIARGVVIENALGGFGSDRLIGNAADNVLTGGFGSDTLTGGAGNDTFQDTVAGHSGDTITDFGVGDRIVFTDANLDGFSFSLSGHTLTYIGGSLTLSTLPSQPISASAAAGGGVQLSFLPVTPIPTVFGTGDFNGDGKDDVLWRSDDGTVTDWLALANGSGAFTGNSNLVTQVPTNWHIAGTGDFNGDGKDDVLWRSDNGTVTNWLALPNGSGAFAGNSNLATQVPTNWHIAGTGDFNGDGRDDVLWRSDDGTVTNWLAQADGTFAGNSSLLTQVAANWHIAGTGDFNGDGRDDVLWRSDDGTVTDWIAQPNGTFAGNSALVTQVPTNWHIAGTGDFNGDGRDDVIWRSDDGYVTAWLGQANGAFGGTSITSLASSWRVAQTGDFNGDGRDDVLWRSDDGHVTDWLGQADGSFSVSNSLNTAVSTTWHVYPQETFL
jgi:Ca2+-binding RTX toxin-like protein